MKFNFKEKKGITLIALVITIIVLLILAGVTIATLTGDNGILTKAQSAKKASTKAEVEEKIKLAVQASKINTTGGIDKEVLDTELENYGITVIAREENTGDLPYTVKKDEYAYTISKTGEVKEKVGIAITTGDIAFLKGGTITSQTVTAELLNGETGTITWSSTGNIELSETTGTTTTVTLKEDANVGDTATVIAKLEEKSQEDTINVKVVTQATGLTIESVTLEKDKTKAIGNIISAPENAENIEITNYEVTENTNIAEVDKKTGIITGKDIGSATITVTAKGKLSGNEVTGTCAVEVTKQLITLTAKQIADNPTLYYGKKVENYKASDSDDNIYRIFYVNTNPDGEFGDPQYTIYLKADDSSAKDRNSAKYSLSNYASYDSANTKIREMNPKWANGETSSTNSTTRGNSENSWNINEQAAAYLCSPVNESNYNNENTKFEWKSYYKPNDNNVNYVIGGPSVEMYVKSYNQTHDSQKKTDENGNEVLDENGSVIMLDAIGCQYQTKDVPGYGYKIYEEIQNGGWTTNVDTIDYSNYDSMYCGKNGNKGSYYWWMASPSSYNVDKVCGIGGQNGFLDWYKYSTSIGLSPIVSLKSTFQPQIEK